MANQAMGRFAIETSEVVFAIDHGAGSLLGASTPNRWNPDRDGGCQHQSAPDKEHQQRRNGGWKVWCGHFRRLFSVGRFSGSHQLETSTGCSNLSH
jgi:hypothetical protein